MKNLKKILKVVFCFLAFAICSFAFAFNPSYAVVYAESAALSEFQDAVNAIKIPSKVNAKEGEFLIPIPTNTISGTKTTIRVIDTSVHNYVVGADAGVNDENYFGLKDGKLKIKALTNGTYKVVFIVEKGTNKFYSNVYTVEVTNVNYALDFKDENGLTKLIPQDLKTGTKFELPVVLAKIVDEDGNLSGDGIETEISVKRNGAVQTLDAAGSDFKTEAGKKIIQVSESGVYTVEYTCKTAVNQPTKSFTINVSDNFEEPTTLTVATPKFKDIYLGETVTLPSELSVSDENHSKVEYNVTKIRFEKESNSNIYVELNNNTFEFEFNPTTMHATSYEDLVGNYNVTYTLKGAYDGQTTTKVFRVEGVTVKGNPSIYLSYDYETTAEGLANVNKDASSELKVKYGFSEIVVPAVYAEDKVTDYSDLIIVRYLVKTTDSSKVYYVDNKKYNESTGALETVASTEDGYNFAEDANIGKVNKSVKFQFSESGEDSGKYGSYYLQYKVISKKIKTGNTDRSSLLYSSGTKQYSIQVIKDAFVEGSAKSTPEVEIANLGTISNVRTDEVLPVKVTASDEDYDNLTTALFYYTEETSENSLREDIQSVINSIKTTELFGKSNVLTDETFASKMQAKHYDNFTAIEESETANTFDLDINGVTSNEITLVAVSINAYGNFAVSTKTLTVKDTTETDAPNFEVVDAGDDFTVDTNKIDLDKTFEQGAQITLPTIKFNDGVNGDKYLTLDVMYYIKDTENNYSVENTDEGVTYKYPSNYRTYYSASEGYIAGGKITAVNAGKYYVIYTATDAAGNTTIVPLTFTVNAVVKSIMSVTPVSNDEIKISGNTITADKGVTISFDTVVKNGETDITGTSNVQVKIDNGDGLAYKSSGKGAYSYIFNGVGDYTVTISATGVESKVFYITTSNPTLKFNSSITVQKYAAQSEAVFLPDISANNGATVTVKVTTPGGSNVDVEKVITENGVSLWKFITNQSSKGSYNVVYTAKTDAETISETFTIKVGDNVAPTFEMEHESELKQDIIYTGTNIEYKLNVNKTNKTFTIDAIKDGETIYSYDLGLKIYDKDDTSTAKSEMTWTNLTYELIADDSSTIESGDNDGQYFIKGVGKFTIKLSVKDNYDNSSEKTISFNVVTETKAEEKNDSVIGVVLIILSLVILAGVIVFFAFTGKKGTSKKVKKSTKATKKVEDKKEEKTEAVVEEKVDEVVEEKVDDKEEVKDEVIVEEPAEELPDETSDIESKEDQE